MKLIIGTYTDRCSEGIYSYDTKVTLECSLENPTYCVAYQDMIFTVFKQNDFGGVAAISNHKVVSSWLIEGTAPCYISFDPIHSCIYAANYHLGRVDVLDWSEEKGITLKQSMVYPTGSKAHFIEYQTRFDQVMVCDLGLDCWYLYAYDDLGYLQAKQIIEVAKGSGPRHALLHPRLNIIYVLMEKSSEVAIYEWSNGLVQWIDTVSTLPTNQQQIKWSAAIRISSDGRFLYVSNRGHDSLTVFSICDDGKKCTLIQNCSTEGIQPRDFCFNLEENQIFVANRESDNITIFDRNVHSGQVTFTKQSIRVCEPVCVFWVK